MVSRTADQWESTWEDLKTSLLDKNYINADETGWRIDGDNGWLWSFSNDDISYYTIKKSRGQKVVDDVLGKSYGGVLISDFYGVYNAINSKKQKCWTHLLRELRNLKEKFPENKEIKVYARRMKYFFKRGVKLKEDYAAEVNVEKHLSKLRDDTQRWADKKHRHADLKRLSKRIFKFRNELYTFIKTGTEPTNNAGEREIRPTVLMRKTSYCNRSQKGAKRQAILMSVINTSKKRNQNFIEMTADRLQQPPPMPPPS